MNNITARDQLIEQIKKSENILIALSSNPTIDELTSALGLTLILNKTNDHVTTIFSGEVPSVLNFLEPDKFFDKTVDGLRDFIIALNPEKADRVRTKVVDGMVRVSITPSQGAVTVEDLEFSQGDYNVDLVIALGVQSQADLDKALEAHGRILHSAFVASVSVGAVTSDLGTLNWQEPALQSYAQIVAGLTLNLEPKLDENGQPVDTVLIDQAVANALMTGLVAVTERFSNGLTTPEVMSLAAVLMGQGANQQLITKELEQPKTPAPEQPIAPSVPENKLETEAIIKTAEPASADAEQMNDLVDKIIETRQVQAETTVAAEQKNDAMEAVVEPTPAPETDAKVTEQKTDSEAVEPQVAEAEKPEATDSPEVALPEPPKPKAEAPVRGPQYAASLPKGDESWDKVNQFKQAFLDKMKKTQEQAAQSRQDELDKVKQAEPPEPPKAEKPPMEVVEPQADKESDKKSEKAKPQKLKKKPAKVIAPLAKSPETGPSLKDQIAQELNPVMPPVAPPMPTGAPLPPPLPPMPPDFDQVTMTGMPPVELNTPQDVLKAPLPSAPQAPPMPTGAPLPPPLPPMPEPMTAPTSQPTPQPAPQPPQPKQPVSQDQFVIPE